jgi:peptidoglycan/xylan/chitin deacetylase (PgdA/CDA1 family)
MRERKWQRSVAATTAAAALAALTFLLADGSAGAAAGAPRTLRVPILMYHRIDVRNPSLPSITQRLTVDPLDFAAEMRWLKRSGYHTLTQEQLFSALVKGGRLPARPVVITFDDGYRNVFLNAAPVLERLHMHAIAYVITGRVSGPDPSFLTWKQLRALERQGVEIGSHTVNHTPLSAVGDARARRELVDSRRALERYLHHPVPWLAYPYGAVNARVVGLARTAGYLAAMTTRGGSIQDGNSPLELRRYEVLDSSGVAGVAAIVG